LPRRPHDTGLTGICAVVNRALPPPASLRYQGRSVGL